MVTGSNHCYTISHYEIKVNRVLFFPSICMKKANVSERTFDLFWFSACSVDMTTKHEHETKPSVGSRHDVSTK